MRTTQQQHDKKKTDIMVKCFECYAENGLTGTGIKTLAEACGCSSGNLYSYFGSLDELIIDSTAYCMSDVVNEFMTKAPTNPRDIPRFIDEAPYWTAKKHGKKYRLMYQIYTHPKYIEYGKEFFSQVNMRCDEYAKELESKVGIPHTVLTSLISFFVQICVYYAAFENEIHLKSQLDILQQSIALFKKKYSCREVSE